MCVCVCVSVSARERVVLPVWWYICCCSHLMDAFRRGYLYFCIRRGVVYGQPFRRPDTSDTGTRLIRATIGPPLHLSLTPALILTPRLLSSPPFAMNQNVVPDDGVRASKAGAG